MMDCNQMLDAFLDGYMQRNAEIALFKKEIMLLCDTGL